MVKTLIINARSSPCATTLIISTLLVLNNAVLVPGNGLQAFVVVVHPVHRVLVVCSCELQLIGDGVGEGRVLGGGEGLGLGQTCTEKVQSEGIGKGFFHVCNEAQIRERSCFGDGVEVLLRRGGSDGWPI